MTNKIKKVDSNIWEYNEFAIIKNYSQATKKYNYTIYKDGELIEIVNTMKNVKKFVGLQ